MANNGLNNIAVELSDKLSSRLNAASLSQDTLSKSQLEARADKRIDAVIMVMQETAKLGDPALALESERLCVEFEKKHFSRGEKDLERYDKQLSEIAAARKSLELTQDAEAYKNHVSNAYGPHREVKFAPAGESYRTFADKQIKQLGRDKLGMVRSKLKNLAELRQVNLRSGLAAYIELQHKSLGLDTPAKNQHRGVERDKSFQR